MNKRGLLFAYKKNQHKLVYAMVLFFFATILLAGLWKSKLFQLTYEFLTQKAYAQANSIQNLNFAVAQAYPWIRAMGLDARFDNGYINLIPSSPSCSGAAFGDPPVFNTIAPGVSLGGRPGVTMVGTNSPNFGTDGGQAGRSPFNWIIQNTASNPYQTFSPTTPQLISTSYYAVQNTLIKSGITAPVMSGCSGSNCQLNSLADGVYRINTSAGTATIYGSGSVPAGVNAIILVNGDLLITTQISLGAGSLVTFIVSGTIYVEPSVGAATPACPPAQHIQGFYSAGRDFVINGTNNCSVAADRQLHIGGGIVANSNLSDGYDGQLKVNRDLCDDNKDFPVLMVQARPDLILRIPSFIKQRSYLFQEAAP